MGPATLIGRADAIEYTEMVVVRGYLDFAVQTAYEAGRLTFGYFRAEMRHDFKPDDSPVTVADREAEQLIRQKIGARHPGHAILGEEYGVEEGAKSSHRWIVDSIDGTKSFIRGSHCTAS